MSIIDVYQISAGSIEYHIEWVSKPIPLRAYQYIVESIMKSRDYGPIDPSKIEAMRVLAQEACRLEELKVIQGGRRNRTASKFADRRHQTNRVEKIVNSTATCDITVGQTISLRNIVVNTKVVHGYSRMNLNIIEIKKEYDAGKNILEISQKWDLPPRNTLMGILRITPEYRIQDIISLTRGKKLPAEVLNKRDREQFELANLHDAEATIYKHIIAKEAEVAEEQFVNALRKYGIRFETQAEMVEWQTTERGVPYATPDVHFLDKVFINNVQCEWIDFKNYMGTPLGVLYDSNRKQAANYNNVFGFGAFAYRWSFLEGLKIPNAMILDCGGLISEINCESGEDSQDDMILGYSSAMSPVTLTEQYCSMTPAIKIPRNDENGGKLSAAAPVFQPKKKG